MEIIDLINVLGNVKKICNEFQGVFGLVGWAILIIKIAVPVILILVGMIDMTKAILSKNDDEIKAAQGGLVKKAIAAVAVFLVIQIVVFLFQYIVGFTDWQAGKCASCLNNPSPCKIVKRGNSSSSTAGHHTPSKNK